MVRIVGRDAAVHRAVAAALTARSAGFVGASLAAVAWGFAGILAALTTCSGITASFWRLLIGACFYSVALAVKRRRLSAAVLRACVPGGLFLAGDVVFFFSAIKLTSIAIVSVIGAMQPVVVSLAARRLFAERRTGWDLTWMAVAIGGVVLTVVGTSSARPDRLSGCLLAAVSMLCWSAYWIVSKRARASYGSLEYTAGVTFVALIVLVPVTLISDHGVGHLTAGDWLPLLLIAVIPGGGHLVMNWVHRYMAASLSSIIGNLNTLVAAVAAVPILGQSLTPVQGLGVVVALGGVIALAILRRGEGTFPVVSPTGAGDP